jgi:hypothetical protein
LPGRFLLPGLLLLRHSRQACGGTVFAILADRACACRLYRGTRHLAGFKGASRRYGYFDFVRPWFGTAHAGRQPISALFDLQIKNGTLAPIGATALQIAIVKISFNIGVVKRY